MSKNYDESRNELSLLDLFDINQIQNIQDAFSDATGVASVITDINGIPLTKPSNFCRLCKLIRKTEKGLKNCMNSDSILGRKNMEGPVMRPCLSSGLWDGGTSIIVGDIHIANWLIGQVRDPDMEEEKILSYASDIGADIKEYKSALDDVIIMSSDQFRKICNFLYIMANQLSELAYKNILEKKAGEEKEELLNKLNQKNKMDALGQLTGGIAHDFNNMLTGILGASQFLETSISNDDPVNLEFVKLIKKSANRAADLTNKLLAFSHKSDKKYKIMDVHSVIDDTIALLNRSIDKRVSITVQKEAQEYLIRGSISDIENVLINLGINSSHAMKERGGELIFKTSIISIDQIFLKKNHLEIEPGNYILINVKDTGCGIPHENIDRIFEPFYTTKDMTKGTGLGLSTVYGVIENHRGAVTVYSKENVGTDFYIYLPLVELSKQKNPVETPMELERGSGYIYLIDDEQMILRTVSANLEKLGYKVASFSNPIDAIKSFEKEYANIDLVLTDMVMPGGNGVDLFYNMKKIDPKCKVILSSGFSQTSNLDKVFADGLSGFLTKPFTKTELSQLVKKVISSSYN